MSETRYPAMSAAIMAASFALSQPVHYGWDLARETSATTLTPAQKKEKAKRKAKQQAQKKARKQGARR